ncbi:unnamed protein product [Phytophthora fragariaefolia]|uniref:Unnamed protein product n=1 Tax=Phytophthora fragariaefolia TaxID=1490495 RepID=A0A9W6Y207_9STRA|nr:unnamed protein product [Phytophthora fragariaefolia]
MSTAAHPETDGQTELRAEQRDSRVDGTDAVLRQQRAAPVRSGSTRRPKFYSARGLHSWWGRKGTNVTVGADPPQSDEPHQETAAEVHVVEGHALHGVAYEALAAVDAAMPAASTVANFAPKPTPTPIGSTTVSELLLHRQAVTRFVRDALQAAADQQKAKADRRGQINMLSFRRGDRVLLSTDGIQGSAVTNLGANKLAPRFIGPLKILKVISDAYTLDIPTSMLLHPTFYVGRLKPYVTATIPAPEAERPRPARYPSRPAADADAESARALAPHASASPSVARRTRATLSDETASASRTAPAPTESQQSSQLQYARTQAQRGSEPPSRRPSLDRSPTSSAGAPSDVSIRSSETPRQSPKPPKLPKPATLQSRGSEATPRSYETTFRRDGPPPLVDASGARRWIAERIVDHETRRTRVTGTAPTSRRACTTEMYYRIRWLGFPPEEDTWESRERLMKDIPDVVKAYEATLELVFDDSGSEDDHDLVSAIAHEYWRGETPGNDDIIATSISDEAPANSRGPNSRNVNSRGASSRDHSDDDHTARSVAMDVSAATSSATRSAASLENAIKAAQEATDSVMTESQKSIYLFHSMPKSWKDDLRIWKGQRKYIPYEDLKQSIEGKVRDIQAQERYALSKGTPETSATKIERASLQKDLQHGRVTAGIILPANFVFKGNSKRDHPYQNPKNWNQGRSNGNGHKNRRDKNNGSGRHQNGSSGKYRNPDQGKNRPLDSDSDDEAENGSKRKVFHHQRHDTDQIAVATLVNPPVSLANVALDPTWTIDTGCTRHVTHESHWFADIATSGGSITVGGKNQIPIEGIGRVELAVIDSKGNPKTLTLHEILYAPQLHFNLLSVPTAVKHDYRFNFDR